MLQNVTKMPYVYLHLYFNLKPQISHFILSLSRVMGFRHYIDILLNVFYFFSVFGIRCVYKYDPIKMPLKVSSLSLHKSDLKLCNTIC